MPCIPVSPKLPSYGFSRLAREDFAPEVFDPFPHGAPHLGSAGRILAVDELDGARLKQHGLHQVAIISPETQEGLRFVCIEVRNRAPASTAAQVLRTPKPIVGACGLPHGTWVKAPIIRPRPGCLGGFAAQRQPVGGRHQQFGYWAQTPAIRARGCSARCR